MKSVILASAVKGLGYKGPVARSQTRLLYHADEPPNKGETLAVHGYHCLGDMALRMREVLARRWVGVFVPLTLSFEFTGDQIRVDPPSPLSQQLPHALFGAGV